MGGRRLPTHATIFGARVLLQSNCCSVEKGLTSFLGHGEFSLKRCTSTTSALHGAVISRSSFLSSRGEGGGVTSSSSSQQRNPYSHGRASSVGTVDSSNSNSTEKEAAFSYWPSSWLKAFSGRMQSLEIDEVLRRVRARKREEMSVATASSFVHRRRMVQNTSRRSQKNGDKPASVLEAGVKYSVVRIDRDGSLEHLELKSSELGVHPRDVDLLSSGTFIPQRATIAVQRDKVLVRMENVRAIVYKNHVLLFDAHHPRIVAEGFVAPEGVKKENASHRARNVFAQSLAKHAKEIPSYITDPMPFHLRVMESLLEETSNFFHQKVDRLKLVVDRILHELTNDVSMGGLQTLLPLRRAVTELEHDVRDAHQAMDQVLCSDENLQALCSVNDECGRPAGPEQQQQQQQDRNDVGGSQASGNREDHLYRLRQAAVDMLLTYQREVDDAGGVLEELRKGMEAAQEVWELGLDTTRNRIIRMNLYFSILTCSLAVATLPAAFFGMNLPSGFEEHPTLFYWVVGAAATAPVLMLGGLAIAFQVLPKLVDKRRAQDLAGLLNLLRHLDSVDEIVEVVTREVKSSKITRKDFQAILRAHHLAQFMRQKELDLIFRMFDRNRNDVLEAEEMRPSSSSSASSKGGSPSSPSGHQS